MKGLSQGNAYDSLAGTPSLPIRNMHLRPNREICGESAAKALAYLEALEHATRPGSGE